MRRALVRTARPRRVRTNRRLSSKRPAESSRRQRDYASHRRSDLDPDRLSRLRRALAREVWRNRAAREPQEPQDNVHPRCRSRRSRRTLGPSIVAHAPHATRTAGCRHRGKRKSAVVDGPGEWSAGCVCDQAHSPHPVLQNRGPGRRNMRTALLDFVQRRRWRALWPTAPQAAQDGLRHTSLLHAAALFAYRSLVCRPPESPRRLHIRFIQIAHQRVENAGFRQHGIHNRIDSDDRVAF